MTSVNTNLSTTRGSYDISTSGGSSITISKAGSNATLTIDKGQLGSLFQKLTSGENPQLDPPDSDQDPVTYNAQLQQTSDSTMDLGELMGQIMALINKENQTYTKEQIAGIASAQSSYKAAQGQADSIKSSAVMNLIGSCLMSGISLGMTLLGTWQGMKSANEADALAGSKEFNPESVTKTSFEEGQSPSKSNPKNQEEQEVSKAPTSLEVESNSSEQVNESNANKMKGQVEKNSEKLDEQQLKAKNEKSRNTERLVNDNRLTKTERDQLYNQVYMNKTQTFQMWTQFGNVAGQSVEKGFGVGAAKDQANATIRGADSQLANTTQQSFASNAQQLNSFFESVRSQIGSIMSGQFQLAGKV